MTLISGEDSALVDRFASKLPFADFTKNCRDKAAAVRAFSERRAIPLREICLMGVDVNDIEAMELVGRSAGGCATGRAQPRVIHCQEYRW